MRYYYGVSRIEAITGTGASLWERGFDALLAGGDVAGAVAVLEAEVVRLLMRGDLLALRAAVGRVPAGGRTLLLRLADADAAARIHAVDLATLDRLRADVDADAAAPPEYRWWMQAVLAEYFLWKSDLAAIAVAVETLAVMPTEDILPSVALVARGRLRRIEALGHLFSFQADARARAFEILDRALADLGRAGWEEERSMTLFLAHFLWAAVSWDDVGESLAVATEAADRLRALGSAYLPSALSGLALLRFIAADMAGAHAALDEAEAVAAGMIPPVDALVRYLRAMATLVGSGAAPAAVACLEEAVDRLRAATTEGAGTVHVTVASVLADFGAFAEARRWFDRARHAQMVTPISGLDRRYMQARLDLVESGDPADVAAAEDVIEEIRRAGFRRDAGIKALKAARDCERIGLLEEADRLRAAGVADVPTPGGRSLWEELWARPLAAAAPVSGSVTASAPAGEIVTLAPDLEVRVGGEAVPLRPGLSRLLAVLVAERRPVTTDRVVDLLWPECDADTGRNRLRVALFRLRRALRIDTEELLVRGRDGVALVPPPGWRVDAWEFWELSQGSVDDRRRALDLYGADFCARELAYDDAVAAERARLRARWSDLAAALVDTGDADPLTVARTALDLEIDDPHLAGVLSSALDATGHPAEAVAVREAVGG